MKKRKPKIVKHSRPSIIDYRPDILVWPNCEAEITSPESLRYRLGKDTQFARSAARRDLTPFQCGNVAGYNIGGQWFCRKHASLIALDMLAVPIEELK
jgi:hypothetical protein